MTLAGCPTLQAEVVSGLADAVGREHVLLSKDDRQEYAYDSFSPERVAQFVPGGPALPLAVVRPGSPEEVRRVVTLANTHRVAVIPFGGGTGVMGAAVPLRPGIVLDLKRLDRIVEVSEGGLMVRVQAGMLLGTLHEELERRGLMLGHDPWSRGITTVGGAISTNGLGYLAAKCGSMGEQVLGLSVVLASGGILQAKTVSKTTGPDMMSLFIGAEGTLGVITEATLRVFATPEVRVVRVMAFESFAKGYSALLEMGRRGIRPSMIDFGEERDKEPPNTFLRLAFEGLDHEAWAQEKAGMDVCFRHGAVDLGAQMAQEFWETRHATAELWARRNAGGRRFASGEPWRANRWFDYVHVALPPEKVLAYKERAEAMIAEAGMECREYGIWGRPDLFSMGIHSPEDRSSEDRAADHGRGQELSVALMVMAQDLGGSMEYCHGVGLKLLKWVPRELNEGFHALQAIKRALDPSGIMNPGKLGL